jgi:hypothetical protein
VKSQSVKSARNRILFVLFFVVLGFVALQIPVNTLAGSRVKFTLFDLFAPISGAFLGTGLGVISVLAMQLSNLAFHGFGVVDNSSILKLVATLRIVPMMFGVWFFAHAASARASQKMLIVPLLSIIIFNLHPIGRTAWVYSMFWLIPFLVWPFCKKSLVARSLGSTFTAHSVGGAIWIWAFNLPQAAWISLIPVTAMERSIFALGISASYILMNNILAYLSIWKLLPSGITYNKKYLFKF